MHAIETPEQALAALEALPTPNAATFDAFIIRLHQSLTVMARAVHPDLSPEQASCYGLALVRRLFEHHRAGGRTGTPAGQRPLPTPAEVDAWHADALAQVRQEVQP